MTKLKHLFNKYLPEITLACNGLFLITLFIILYDWLCKSQMPSMIVSGLLFTILVLNTIGLILDSLIKIRDRK